MYSGSETSPCVGCVACVCGGLFILKKEELIKLMGKDDCVKKHFVCNCSHTDTSVAAVAAVLRRQLMTAHHREKVHRSVTPNDAKEKCYGVYIL